MDNNEFRHRLDVAANGGDTSSKVICIGTLALILGVVACVVTGLDSISDARLDLLAYGFLVWIFCYVSASALLMLSHMMRMQITQCEEDQKCNKKLEAVILRLIDLQKVVRSKGSYQI